MPFIAYVSLPGMQLKQTLKNYYTFLIPFACCLLCSLSTLIHWHCTLPHIWIPSGHQLLALVFLYLRIRITVKSLWVSFLWFIKKVRLVLMTKASHVYVSLISTFSCYVELKKWIRFSFLARFIHCVSQCGGCSRVQRSLYPGFRTVAASGTVFHLEWSPLTLDLSLVAQLPVRKQWLMKFLRIRPMNGSTTVKLEKFERVKEKLLIDMFFECLEFCLFFKCFTFTILQRFRWGKNNRFHWLRKKIFC